MKQKTKKSLKELWKAIKATLKEFHDYYKTDEEKAVENLLNDYIGFDYKAKIKALFKKIFKSKK